MLGEKFDDHDTFKVLQSKFNFSNLQHFSTSAQNWEQYLQFKYIFLTRFPSFINPHVLNMYFIN